MAADIGIRIGVEGEKTFKSALNGINAQLKNLSSEMKAAVTSMTDLGDEEAKTAKRSDILNRTIDASKQKIQLISGQYDRAKASLDELGRELDEAKRNFGENSDEAIKAQNAYNRQAAAVNKLGAQLNDATAEMNKMEAELRDIRTAADRAENSMDDLADAAKDVGQESKGMGSGFRDAFAGGVISGFIQSAVDGMRNLVDSTKEYRTIMATLENSSARAGYTADQTTASYKQLYGILGDEQSSATALANFQALGLSQEQLTLMIDGAIGAWATYGDSIPIDSLGEAINETIRVGQVTGTFADMLNWAGTSEDEFNEKLAACTTETERANLVLQEMANQGLIDAADAWRIMNPELVAANEAQLNMNDSLANLATVISPAVTSVTNGIAGLITGVTTLTQNMGPFVPMLAGAATAAAAFGIAINIGTILSGLSSALGVVTGGVAALNAVLLANPIALVVALLAGLVAGLVTAYNTSETFRAKVDAAFAAVNNAGAKVTQALTGFFTQTIPNAFQSAAQKADDAKNRISNAFEGIRSAAQNKINAARDAVQGAIDRIQSLLGSVANMSFSLPKLKLPRISISGKFSLTPPSAPKFSISWYKHGGIMMDPTIFGASGTNLLAGGEAGPEAIAPIDVLQDYVSKAVDSTVSDVLTRLLPSQPAGETLPPIIVPLYINGKEFYRATIRDLNQALRDNSRAYGKA